MNNKLIKKIIGIFGYKLVEKNLIKNNRLISNKSIFTIKFVLEKYFKNNQIRSLIQIGANDGKRFDELNYFIKKYKTRCILVEPIKEYFDQLQSNYINLDYVKLENSAISANENEKILYGVNNKYMKNYTDHVRGLDSFNINHLIKHGVKRNHIIQKEVKCISISNLILKYQFNNLDLLFIDAEGYDGEIVKDFLLKVKQKPILIFEYIHIDTIFFKNLILEIEKSNYIYFSINENLICIPIGKEVCL